MLADVHRAPSALPCRMHACNSCIAKNYGRIREVERELANLQFQLKLTAGPKKHALELLRRKIEDQNDKVVYVRKQHTAAKLVRNAPIVCMQGRAGRGSRHAAHPHPHLMGCTSFMQPIKCLGHGHLLR